MPRKNHTPPHVPYRQQASRESAKRRFSSRQAALNGIKEIQKYHLDIQLSVYHSPADGGWYLTSNNNHTDRNES